MVPIILASIIAAAIILERLWTLQQRRVLPAELTEKVWRWVEQSADQPSMSHQRHQSGLTGNRMSPHVFLLCRRTLLSRTINSLFEECFHEDDIGSEPGHPCVYDARVR